MEKILVFGMTDNPGGIESVIMNYYRNINHNKIQFDFLCNSHRIAYEEEIKELGGHIYKITARKENYIKFKTELKQFMKENAGKYLALWVNVCSLVNIDYLILAKQYGICKRIIHCHNSANDGGIVKGLIHRLNKMRLNHYATDFWSCSEQASPWFFSRKILLNEHYKIIPNAIDVKRYEKNEAVRKEYRKELKLDDKYVIGHVGRFHFQKNHRFLIEIFSLLAERDEQYHLLLVGQGELEQEIKDLVTKKKLEKRVTFCGARTDVENLYQAMDMFVLPSVFEGLGIVGIEAQACLLPCLFADTVPAVIKLNSNVQFLPLKSPEAWVEMVEKNRVNSVGNVENNVLKSEYNIAVQVKKFERILT